MSDSRTINGKVKVENDSREAVAFEMTKLISDHELSPDRQKREYWLTLYSQCHKATLGYSLERVLGKD